jgi:hypothetical protein
MTPDADPPIGVPFHIRSRQSVERINGSTDEIQSPILISTDFWHVLSFRRLATMPNAKLPNAILTNTILLNAILPNAILLNAILTNAILLNVILSNTILLNAILPNAILLNAILPNTIFAKYHFCQIPFLPNTIFAKYHFCQMPFCQMPFSNCHCIDCCNAVAVSLHCVIML